MNYKFSKMPDFNKITKLAENNMYKRSSGRLLNTWDESVTCHMA
jgi:hypothetical protein